MILLLEYVNSQIQSDFLFCWKMWLAFRVDNISSWATFLCLFTFVSHCSDLVIFFYAITVFNFLNWHIALKHEIFQEKLWSSTSIHPPCPLSSSPHFPECFVWHHMLMVALFHSFWKQVSPSSPSPVFYLVEIHSI